MSESERDSVWLRRRLELHRKRIDDEPAQVAYLRGERNGRPTESRLQYSSKEERAKLQAAAELVSKADRAGRIHRSALLPA